MIPFSASGAALFHNFVPGDLVCICGVERPRRTLEALPFGIFVIFPPSFVVAILGERGTGLAPAIRESLAILRTDLERHARGACVETYPHQSNHQGSGRTRVYQL